jgi:Cu2+-exporting ATPase
MREIIDVILQAQRNNNKLQSSAEHLASAIVPGALILSLLSFLYWLPAGIETALNFMTATLVVTCLWALGLSVPAALMVASGLSTSTTEPSCCSSVSSRLPYYDYPLIVGFR